MEKPKNLHHQSNAGVLSFFQGALNTGKGVQRTTSDSIKGKRLMSAKGSISAENETLWKASVLSQRKQLPKPGCGAKESQRRLKQLNKHG